MKCYLCDKPTTQGKGNRVERVMTPDDLPHMKKLKPNAKVKDKFELCNECYPKVYPGAAIRLTVPTSPPIVRKGSQT
jgi:hypothetical protein